MKKSAHLLLSFILLSFTGCQDILECIINRRPELVNKTLAVAQVDQYYTETITADIKNEPLDDYYSYYFSINGELPRGIEYSIDYRTINLEGIPLDSGSYKFKVRLGAAQYNNYSDACENQLNDCDGLCEESTTKEYTIVVY